jgi:ornithine cyclodeaminase
MPELRDLELVRARSTAEACRGADIVTTVTADKRNAVILTPPMVAPGMHLNAVGGDCPGKTELHGDILRMPQARVIVEYEPQSRIEGEIQQMEATYPVTEFADVVLGRSAGRRSDADITIFDSVGFALEDYSALRFLHLLLDEGHIGRRQIDLVPSLDNPKDLFGGTLGAGVARPRLIRTG